ncbi:MAG: endolytic transglycosylase MltG [Sphingobacteriales bacterium]|nr:MAG: endolytic transglycosylase MltG [Sphingobacteriales bacterium]
MTTKIKNSIAIALISAGSLYFMACGLGNNVSKEGKLHIPTNAKLQQIIDSIQPLLKDTESFRKYALDQDLEKRFYSGRYSIKKGMSNKEIVQMIREGKQDEIAIRIGNYASIIELSGKLGNILEADSAEILEAIVQADFTKEIDTAKKLYFFLPNTYNFHWNTSGKGFVEKMFKEYQKFWNEERLALAKAANMSPLEVTTLASIVQLESAKADEQARVAALYLNRLNIGMKLDADPTIVFIKKMQRGFTQKVSRVYYKDLAIVSPYNTYTNKGLPPGPICMPNPSAIDAVLKPEKHDYIYFVADTARPGYHLFAKTLKEQEVNAAAYRAWADKNNVN